MNREIVKEYRGWFDGYVRSFRSDDRELQRNIEMKEKHTLRVCDEILSLGEELGLHNGDLQLAEVLALFHDVGRFEQYAYYRTFVDRDSEDHAALGVKILKENEVLVGLDNRTRNLILRSISYHNRATLPLEETEECLFCTKLLRDADKLDIWKVVTDYYRRKNWRRNVAIELGLPDTPGISDAVYKSLMREEIINAGHLNNLNDFKLLQVGWIYSINFAPTFDRIEERKYLDIIRDYLPRTEQIEQIFSVVQTYLTRSIQT
jgi:putative nucleotidyltransferase with HDIG domain